MKCCVCKRNIASGVDAAKMVIEYTQDDGTTKVFGFMMPDGPLMAATGRMLRAWHHKHFHMQRKREQRGDAVTGRVLAGIPTGYEISDLVLSREESEALGLTEEQARAQGTAYLSARLERLRECARRVGKAVGDGTVAEAFAAEEHGGPYPHTHHLRLDTYQLLAHLKYAHGVRLAGALKALSGDSQQYHDELHASVALEKVRSERAADPDYVEPSERDWREQQVVDI